MERDLHFLPADRSGEKSYYVRYLKRVTKSDPKHAAKVSNKVEDVRSDGIAKFIEVHGKKGSPSMKPMGESSLKLYQLRVDYSRVMIADRERIYWIVHVFKKQKGRERAEVNIAIQRTKLI